MYIPGPFYDSFRNLAIYIFITAVIGLCLTFINYDSESGWHSVGYVFDIISVVGIIFLLILWVRPDLQSSPQTIQQGGRKKRR